MNGIVKNQDSERIIPNCTMLNLSQPLADASRFGMAKTDDARSDGEIMLSVGGLQNKAWAADTSKFGYQMLLKMGWSAGKGLGKKLEGQASHVKVVKRSENLGIGCSLKQAEVSGWNSTAQSFSEILAGLNETYGKKNENDERKEKKKKKKMKKEEKKKKIHKKKKKSIVKEKSVEKEKQLNTKKILYHKRLRNKNAKAYSAEDLSGILGVAISS